MYIHRGGIQVFNFDGIFLEIKNIHIGMYHFKYLEIMYNFNFIPSIIFL